MYQHQHAPLPLEQLENVPQPVVVLLEVLLEKDPRRRFQTPAELLKVMPTIMGAIEKANDNSSEPGADGRHKLYSRRNSRATSKTGTKEDFRG